MFVVRPGGELVGYSEWPWDRLYAPVVGCFYAGRLQTFAICNQEPQRGSLKGPAIRCWFRMKLAADLLRRLLEDDPDIRLIRLEDGVPVSRAGQNRSSETDGSALVSVEALLSGGEARRPARLDGFPLLLGAPVVQQVDCLYLDILGRPVDPAGYASYGVGVVNGDMSLLALRDALLESEEFANRGITVSERVGSLITSHMWHELSRLESPGQRYRPIPPFAIRDYATMDTEAFVTACYDLLLARPVDPTGLAHYAYMAEQEGRFAVATELSREAAHRGVFLNVVEA